MAPVLAGTLLLPDDTVQGWVEVEEGTVVDAGDGQPDTAPDATGWITPRPVNAHTHVADAFLHGQRGMPTSLPELVGPGGWKHRQLAMARRGRTGAGVVRYARQMAEHGTTHFIDFRENGVVGATFLRDLAERADWVAAEGLDMLPVEPIVFGRPSMNNFDPDEAEDLMSIVDGIGLSALRDFEEADDAMAWAEVCQAEGKPLALHASEERHEPLGDILALGPAFLVHMCQATPPELQAAADQGVPIVICPRSNRFFGIKTPVMQMIEAGCHLAIGTDNGMLQDGDLMQELAQIRQWYPAIPEADLLRMLTFGGRALLGDMPPWPPEPGDRVPALLPDVPAYATQ